MKANFYKCVVIFCALLTTLTITVHATPTRYADDCFDRNRQL